MAKKTAAKKVAAKKAAKKAAPAVASISEEEITAKVDASFGGLSREQARTVIQNQRQHDGVEDGPEEEAGTEEEGDQTDGSTATE